MIAKLDIRKCPWRKEVIVIDYKCGGNGTPMVNTAENFLECIEAGCMAWDEKARDCRLMMKDKKEEKK